MLELERERARDRERERERLGGEQTPHKLEEKAKEQVGTQVNGERVSWPEKSGSETHSASHRERETEEREREIRRGADSKESSLKS